MDLSNARWRKASRSTSNGGDCVEIAAVWRKASRSGENGACVEIAAVPGIIAVRDSKNPDGPALTLAPSLWDTFMRDVKDGRHDLI